MRTRGLDRKALGDAICNSGLTNRNKVFRKLDAAGSGHYCGELLDSIRLILQIPVGELHEARFQLHRIAGTSV
jgi:hypothetical protein